MSESDWLFISFMIGIVILSVIAFVFAVIEVSS